MAKKCLVLGGTGTIGSYLVPGLLKLGYVVDVTSRLKRSSGDEHLSYIHGDAKDDGFLKEVLENKYDAIIDFMVYSTDEFQRRHELLLKNTKHYVFTSSGRVFAESKKSITERTPRLLDTCKDKEYLKTDEYALAKARQEDILRKSKYQNWTITRPTITYGHGRFQLGTLESNTVVFRSLQNCPVILPGVMMSKITTMTWSGDVAKMVAKIVLNHRAFADDFNLVTAEAHQWKEVAEHYGNLIGLRVKTTSLEQYIEVIGNEYQIRYARMFSRRFNNAKILQLTGLKQGDLTPLYDGLKNELTDFVKNPRFGGIDYAMQARIDKLTGAKIDLSKASPEERNVYQKTRYPLKTELKRMLRPRTRLRQMKYRLIQAKRRIRLRTRFKDSLCVVHKWYVRQKSKSADGVILTLPGYYNYGNIVQRYALQEFLRQHGYKFISCPGKTFGRGGTETGLFRYTARFVKERIWSKQLDSGDDFPVYIVGSDQVWRNWGYDNENKELGYYFFNFVQRPQTKRVAYAASFGQNNIDDAMISSEFVEYVEPFIKKLDYISMRENSGVKIMKDKWGVKAQHVVDPTMLLTTDDYDVLIKKSPHKLSNTNPIFAYVLDLNKYKEKIIQKISSETKNKVDGIYPYQLDVLPPVEQWLKGFRDAKIVVTDSFHGTIFAIINNTSFVVIENKNGGVSRLTSLLGQFGLQDRLVAEDKAHTLQFNRLKPINWDKVNHELDRLCSQSADWLLNSIEKPKTKTK